jgi:hypothetical protein
MYYGQWMDDALIEGVFNVIGTTNKYCFEVGAGDGIQLSNTRYFMEHGWHGCFAESNVEKFEKLEKLYPEENCFNIEIGTKYPVDRLLQEAKAPKVLDLISIDIDGQDYYLWRDMKEYSSRVVVIEWSPYKPMDYIPVINSDREEGANGAGLRSMIRLAFKKKYIVVAITPTNLICIRSDLWPKRLNMFRGEFLV